MLNAAIFRECDIRGIADRDLPSEGVVAIGRGLGSYLRRRAGPAIHVGRDCRLSGDRLHGALCEGLLAAGCHVTDLGVVPTPVTYYSAVAGKADGAVMITGSHNRLDYNGFKTVCAGEMLHGEAVQEIRRMIAGREFLSGKGTIRTADVVPGYVDDRAGRFHFARRLKVVVDSGNGVAGPVIGRILRRLNCEFISLFDEMDGRFPNHHPDPSVPGNLRMLADKVKETGADLGIGFDGDADRIGAVDDRGEPVFGDMLLLIFARQILQRRPGATVVGDVKCSQTLFDEVERMGGRGLMCRTGHSLIQAKMREEGAALAGELSGHVFFCDLAGRYDDAMYAGCRLMEIVAASSGPLSRQLEGVRPVFSTPEMRLEMGEEEKFAVVAKVAAHFAKTRQIVNLDGARILFPRGWGLVRASNTEPALVMRYEAETKELLECYRAEVEAVVRGARLG